MNSRLFFRENGSVIRTHSMWREVLTLVVAVVSIVCLLGWGHAVDQKAEDDLGFAAGLVAGRQEMAETVGDAYRRGRQDAMADMCPAPAMPVAPAVRQPRGAL